LVLHGERADRPEAGRAARKAAVRVVDARGDREGTYPVPGPVDVAGRIAVGALHLVRLDRRLVQRDAAVLDEALGGGRSPAPGSHTSPAGGSPHAPARRA